MTFELVRYGWPNAVAVLALAAMPFVALGLPAERPSTTSPVESIYHSEQRIAVASIAE